jgi:3',5'-nucleoside bisphosphate phosphatase
MLCDFHIHSCLSPCASLDMSPSAIARAARTAGLDAIALTDHHSALNAPAFAAACRREGLRALYGMEICTAEEIHVLALFDTPVAALGLGSFLYDRLPDFPNRPDQLGDQAVVDEHDHVLELVERYLGNATNLRLSELPGLIAAHGGLFLPAHIDRPASGVLSRLGTLPPECGAILEATPRNFDALQTAYGATHTLVTFSDAHEPAAIGRAATRIEIDPGHFTLPVLRAALLARRTAPVF